MLFRSGLFSSAHLTTRLRSLHGVCFDSDEGIDRFARCSGLGGLRELKIAFIRNATAGALARLFRSRSMEAVETLWLSFDTQGSGSLADPEVQRRASALLADPAVLPRLRTLVTWDRDLPALQGVRDRLGPGLKT